MTHVRVRALVPGDGAPLAKLWRELWLAHETWGGYGTSRDEGTFLRVAERLEADARARAGDVASGHHLHLVATDGSDVVGQVEGWLDRFGFHARTPETCEVRSLIVDKQRHGSGVGRALLTELEKCAVGLARGPISLVAEVLDQNPAVGFYEKLGFRPISWTQRLVATDASWLRASQAGIRLAAPGDEMALARFESQLATRRQRQGDLRYDPPQAIDATYLHAIRGALLADSGDANASERYVLLGGEDPRNERLLATCMVSTHKLEPPFASLSRTIVARVSVRDDTTDSAARLIGAVAARARSLAPSTVELGPVEIGDLPSPGSSLYENVRARGGQPWSRIVQRASKAR